MQHLEVGGAVRHIYIYIYVVRRLKVKDMVNLNSSILDSSWHIRLSITEGINWL